MCHKQPTDVIAVQQDGRADSDDRHGECRHEIHRLQEEVKSLRAMMKAMRALPRDIPRENLEVMVRLAYEMEVFSGGRCAEILDECIQTFMERGWAQSRIRDVLDEMAEVTAGRLVREVVNQILKDYE